MRRVDAWALREKIRDHALAPTRLRHCGKTRYAKTVELQTAGDHAWWHGVVCCRARVCPPCFVARRFKLAHEIEHVVMEREAETRQQSVLATLTVRHHAGDPVQLTRAVRVAWRDLLQSRAWRTFVREHGIEFVVAEEVTRGANGWHPHLHALLMPRVRVNTDDPWQLSGVFHEWWSRSVRRKIGEAQVPSRERGCDLRPCDSAAYLSKVGLELSDPAMVKGRSPLDLLSHGDVELYMQLQASRTRARDVTYSRGLRGIRDAMPGAGDVAILAEVSGSQWGRIREQGWAVPLEIADSSEDPESAAAAIQLALSGRSPAKTRG